MYNKTRLLTPGPTPIPSRTRLAMAREMMHHRKPVFKDIMHALQPKLKTLFGTVGTVLPLSCSGTGAMTAAVHTLFNANEKLLIVSAGKFGERFEEIAIMHGCKVQTLKFEWGTAIDAEAIKQALDADKNISGVLMQLCETSTGVLHPVADVAAITKQRNVLLVVDGISAVGISPCPMDELGIDCLLTGSQKGLMVPPGLSLIALSERAWEKAKNVKQTCYYFNLLQEKKKIEDGQTLFTSPVSLIIGLNESLDIIYEIGLNNLYAKQFALSNMARCGVKALGLELFVPKHFAWGLTSILLPQGIDGTRIVQNAAKNYNVIMAGGQDHLKGRIVRIGHMGFVDSADLSMGLYALAMSIKEVGGYIGARDYLERAFDAYNYALANYPETDICDIR